MKGNSLELLSPKYFTKHRILNDELEHPKLKGFEEGEFIWCKIDKESQLSKRNVSGMRLYNVWAITDDLKRITMMTIDQAARNLSNPIKKGKAEIRPTAPELNKLLTKVRNESQRLIDLRKHQAVIVQNHNQAKSKSGYAIYTYNHMPLRLINNGKTLFKLVAGDKFKIKHIEADKNELIIKKESDETFIIDDLRLCMLICRSGRWLENR